MNIVVLCGGISTEREVSLWSAENICNALRSRGHKAILLDVFLGRKDINKDNAFNSLMEVSEELELIKKSAENIEEIKKNSPNNNWRKIDDFIKGAFAHGVIPEFQRRFLKYIRASLK